MFLILNEKVSGIYNKLTGRKKWLCFNSDFFLCIKIEYYERDRNFAGIREFGEHT